MDFPNLFLSIFMIVSSWRKQEPQGEGESTADR
jgi:hypothetical protein